MVEFTTTIKKFGEMGEKSGWTYIDVPEPLAMQLFPGNKKSFRVKGRLDNYVFERVALIPIGGGNFIMGVNAEVRKRLGKRKGATVSVAMEVDSTPVQLSPELMQCLADEPRALDFFNRLPGSHQKYYSKWVEGAKTVETKARRIAKTITACLKSQHYSEMMKYLKEEKDSQ